MLKISRSSGKLKLQCHFCMLFDPISLCKAKLARFISRYLALKILCFILETTEFKLFILS